MFKWVSPIMSRISWSEELFIGNEPIGGEDGDPDSFEQCLARRWRVI